MPTGRCFFFIAQKTGHSTNGYCLSNIALFPCMYIYIRICDGQSRHFENYVQLGQCENDNYFETTIFPTIPDSGGQMTFHRELWLINIE